MTRHRLAVVTGAFGHLGTPLCLQLADSDYSVFAAGRGEPSSEMQQHPNITTMSLDLAKGQQRKDLVAAVRGLGGWDLLIDLIGEMAFTGSSGSQQVIHLTSTARAGLICALMQRGGMHRDAHIYASVPALASLERSLVLGPYARGQQHFTSRLRQLGVDYLMESRVHLMVVGRLNGGIWKNVRGLSTKTQDYLTGRQNESMSPRDAAADIYHKIVEQYKGHLFVGDEAAQASVHPGHWLITAPPEYVAKKTRFMDEMFAGCHTVHQR